MILPAFFKLVWTELVPLILLTVQLCTAQKAKFSVKDFFGKCDQIRSFHRIWSHLLKKSLMEPFIFCAVLVAAFLVDVDFKHFLKVP